MSESYIGLMSGTSLDGVDAVLADFGSAPPVLIATHFLPYPQNMKDRLLALHRVGSNELHDVALIGNELARLYHKAVETVLKTSRIEAESVSAIGCHGQTIRHNPRAGYTYQLGNPALLAELSGISVITDFRSRDIAAGGQGAPLVPAFHDAIFRTPDTHRVILNIGGIANITNLKPGSITGGFDTGPGNMLLDAWIYRHSGQGYDANGNWAASGNVLSKLLEALLAHPYFSQEPPKSCGREQFNLEWVASIQDGGESAEDIQATLLALSATSIASAIERWCNVPEELVVCGGGAHNTALLKHLSVLLPSTRVLTSDLLGVGGDWLEAMGFAWLARQALLGLPGNLPSATGAKGPRILGALYPR